MLDSISFCINICQTWRSCTTEVWFRWFECDDCWIRYIRTGEYFLQDERAKSDTNSCSGWIISWLAFLLHRTVCWWRHRSHRKHHHNDTSQPLAGLWAPASSTSETRRAMCVVSTATSVCAASCLCFYHNWFVVLKHEWAERWWWVTANSMSFVTAEMKRHQPDGPVHTAATFTCKALNRCQLIGLNKASVARP